MLQIDQRKTLYQDLATLFRYPDQELMQLLQQAERWSAVSRHFALPLPEGLTGFDRTSLEEAYTALFDTGLRGAVAPPYGSVYLDESGHLMGASARQVAACYAAAGLRLDGSPEPADFLATELEYLYYLVDCEAAALKSRELAGARDMTGRQREFLASWLLPWLPEFVARLEARPLHPLYPWAGRLLLAFGNAELDWLQRLAKIHA